MKITIESHSAAGIAVHRWKCSCGAMQSGPWRAHYSSVEASGVQHLARSHGQADTRIPPTDLSWGRDTALPVNVEPPLPTKRSA